MTQSDKIIRLLSDCKFHSNVELCNLVWWKFSARLHDLKKIWYVFEKEHRKEWDKHYIEYWKMIETPFSIDCSDIFEPIKIERETTLQRIIRNIKNIF